jgi:16S rRNA (cytidine1402-2'-O)-methyltransferase
VLVLDRAPPRSASAADLTEALTAALSTTTLRDAVDRVAADLGLPRRTVYQRALALGKEKRDD